VLDSSIVNVALPDMSGTLGATIQEITWVVTAYILAQVIVMPITGLLSARFGRKNFYIASVFLFTGASMACGLARSLTTMVVFRILQGFGGGVLLTVSQAILRESFPAEEQGLAMGLYGLGAVLAPAFGPTLGGYITDQYAWPWIFYVNVPVGIVCIVLVSRYIVDPHYLVREKGYIDWPGLALLVIGLGSFQLMLEDGERNDWFQSAYITRLTIIAVVALVGFVWRELTAAKPAVNLRILKNLSFTSATAIGGVLGIALNGSLFLLPVFLQNLLGFNAMQSGVTLMPRSLAMAVLMPIGGRFYNRLGPRVLVGSGLVIAGYGFYTMSKLTIDIGFWDLFWPQLWQGVGFAIIFVALSTAALSTITKPAMTAATGLYNVVRQVMGSVGIALAATILSTSTTRYHAVLSEDAGASPVASQMINGFTSGMVAKGSDWFTAHQRALGLIQGAIERQAAVLAYNHVFVLVSALFAFGLPLVLLLRSGTPSDDAEMMID
ncbi:MAG TPA: DHA2 family efflux MFS transporter permease subunit, partial [Gemmatimonadaceae bacterium]|jgi:DHA2 family multidrug resistance protein|nr:DHA2 family efflux MFS transporter permease subunit [Gemmatimonadaceae bacterium]